MDSKWKDELVVTVLPKKMARHGARRFTVCFLPFQLAFIF
jgi:hypothetical protein